ncbi:MAG: efflux transporter outer membrane subunit, partial [Candidatus Omnitrophota bacterium]
DDVLKSQEAYYELIKKSYELGNTSELDLRPIQAQVQIAKVNAAEYTRQRQQAINALLVLLGTSIPSDLPKPQPLLSQGLLSDLSPGLPSDLLQRRPDILEAEYQLKAANANIGAARAAFFPKILLTGSAGGASFALSNLLSGPMTWSFSPQIILPIFDAGANKANLDLSQISKRIEVAKYEKTIQMAFREVADALIARETFNEQIQAQQDLVTAQKKRYDLADVRYRNGIDSYLNVLTAQQDLYNAQQNLIKSRFNQLANLVTLYKTLGGGWEDEVVPSKAH